MKTLISDRPLVCYVLVLSDTKECWVNMRQDLFQITDSYYKDPSAFRIEKWIYYRYDEGDELVKQEIMEGYDGY